MGAGLVMALPDQGAGQQMDAKGAGGLQHLATRHIQHKSHDLLLFHGLAESQDLVGDLCGGAARNRDAQGLETCAKIGAVVGRAIWEVVRQQTGKRVSANPPAR